MLLTTCSSGNGQETITLSGTISITYKNQPVPFIEIGVDAPGHDWINSTRLESPGNGVSWSIEIPAFKSSTEITFRVMGYSEKNICLFDERPETSISVHKKDINGIALNLGNISNNPVNIIPLIEDKWSNGEITEARSVEWYSLDVVAGTPYYIWWNDSASGDGTKMLDIDVYAYDSSEESITLEDNDNAWYDPVSFTTNYTGPAYLRVRALYLASSTGTYAIVYSRNNSRPDNTFNNITGIEQNPIPLILNAWTSGSLPSSESGRTIWYSFNVTNGTTYYIWWNDKGEGDGTNTLDIKADAYYIADGSSIFLEIDSAWTNPKIFKATSTGKVKLKVSPFFRLDDPDNPSILANGTFAITYNTTGTRP